MRDFTGALYLGMQHPHESLSAWQQLTLGRPAALQEPPGAQALAAALADLQGCEAAVLLPSSLHLFWDLFAALCDARSIILHDVHLYAVARWGIERAVARGTPARSYGHQDITALQRLSQQAAESGRRPIVVTDGLCTCCGRSAPLPQYVEIARRHDGYVVIDDTQALGILGSSPSCEHPFGMAGGGSLRWQGLNDARIVVASSLAKTFGAPLAVLSGSRTLLDRFRSISETRLHCSPPSVAAIHAGHRALQMNRRHGERLRRRLWYLIGKLRTGLAAVGLRPLSRRIFPVQGFAPPTGIEPFRLWRQLQRAGIGTVVGKTCGNARTALLFLLSAAHDDTDVEHAIQAVATELRDAGHDGHRPINFQLQGSLP